MDPFKKIWIHLFARQRFTAFNDRLLRRGLTGLGINDFGPRQENGEKHLLEKLARTLPQGAVVFDVGAHTGLYSMFLAGRRPDLIIHAFEPNPVTYAKLAANAEGCFATHPFALGDKDGEAMLHDSKPGGGSECASLIGDVKDESYAQEKQQKISVEVKRLDRVAEDVGCTRIDFLKIDAEGYDLMVLRGASHSIASDRIGIVQFEFGPSNVFSRTFMRDFYHQLPNHSMHRIVQDGLVRLGDYHPLRCELFGLQNIVAVPKTFEPQWKHAA
jgi:FkbM family methyltransferase